MAIDFGEKRVGIASTDESEHFALPRMVLPNDEELLKTVSRLADDWRVEKIIVGESRDFKGGPNPIFEKAGVFADLLISTGKSVEFHPELLTSAEAVRIQGENEMTDASAAAIILKSYMDSRRFS